MTRSACVAVQNDQGLVLAIRGPKWDGRPALPGGKALPGERWPECARRECEEETGLRVRLVRRLLVARAGPHICAAYGAVAYGGTLRGSAEGEPVWLPREALVVGGAFPDFYGDLFEALAMARLTVRCVGNALRAGRSRAVVRRPCGAVGALWVMPPCPMGWPPRALLARYVGVLRASGYATAVQDDRVVVMGAF